MSVMLAILHPKDLLSVEDVLNHNIQVLFCGNKIVYCRTNHDSRLYLSSTLVYLFEREYL